MAGSVALGYAAGNGKHQPAGGHLALLIDGYNLLHVTGLFGRGPGATFEQSRWALLQFLAQALSAAERQATTIVFDAAGAPPGLASEYSVHGIRVLFARDHADADALLEELIAADAAPRTLTVVSSDHRVQRAAKKRRAAAIDSHVWYGAAHQRLARRGHRHEELDVDLKPDEPLSPGEVQAWIKLFGPLPPLNERPPERSPRARPAPTSSRPPMKAKPPESPTAAERPPHAGPRRRANRAPHQPPRTRSQSTQRKPPDHGFGDIDNPFPPGYGEDVARE